MKDLEHFRNKLLTLRSQLSLRLSTIDRDIREQGISADMDDQSIELESEEVRNALSKNSERELAMIETAIQRLDAGEYFTCLSCDEEIPHARLELLPFTSQCVSCAEKLEHQRNT